MGGTGREGFVMTKHARIVAPSCRPGLARIWSGQEILGILSGVFFAAALNVAVMGRWIQPGALPSGWAGCVATLAGVTWLASLSYTIWWARSCHPDRHRIEIDRHFRAAHEAYLRGHRGESRRRIERITARDESDSDAVMQVGTPNVSNTPADLGAKWRWEIRRALARLSDGGSTHPGPI
jgi:hypothetical protein